MSFAAKKCQPSVPLQVYVRFGPPPASDKSAAATAIVAYVVFAAAIPLIEGLPQSARGAAVS
ncbi:MAG: hypothetical protein DMF50_00655 [Acidobacteria bacterium]|nr:MAG: hypothetical protein DMF50_00655 [Acidobacteriota bacterium]